MFFCWVAFGWHPAGRSWLCIVEDLGHIGPSIEPQHIKPYPALEAMIWIKERANSSSTCFRKLPDNRHNRRMLKPGKWCDTMASRRPGVPRQALGPLQELEEPHRIQLKESKKEKQISHSGGCIFLRTLYQHWKQHLKKGPNKNNQTCTCTSGEVPSKNITKNVIYNFVGPPRLRLYVVLKLVQNRIASKSKPRNLQLSCLFVWRCWMI